MTKTCCMDCKTTPEECGIPNCRTTRRVSWCNQKPNKRNILDDYAQTYKERCSGTCQRFKGE